MPGALLVANGDRSAADDTLDGLVLESFADSAVDPDRDALKELSKYVRTSLNDGLRQPTTTITSTSVETSPPARPRIIVEPASS